MARWRVRAVTRGGGSFVENGTWATFDDFTNREITGNGEFVFQIYASEDTNQSLTEAPGTANKIMTVQGATTGSGGTPPFGEVGLYIYSVSYTAGDGFGHASDNHQGAAIDYGAVTNLRFRFKAGVTQTFDNTAYRMSVGNYRYLNSSTQGPHWYWFIYGPWRAGLWHLIDIGLKVQSDNNTGVVDGGGNDWPTSTIPFDTLANWYLDTHATTNNGTWSLKKFEVGIVGSQDDNEIGPVIVHYDTTDGRYKVSWASRVRVNRTFDVRASTSSLKVNGFTSGTLWGSPSNSGDDYPGVTQNGPVEAESTTGIYIGIRRQGQTDFRQVFIPYHLSQADQNPANF